jgi:hypothetical protein
MAGWEGEIKAIAAILRRVDASNSAELPNHTLNNGKPESMAVNPIVM